MSGVNTGVLGYNWSEISFGVVAQPGIPDWCSINQIHDCFTGALALYTGLSAGLLRQATYTTTRLGIYTSLCDTYKGPDGNIKFMQKVAFGMLAGGTGAFVGTPAELALIRMTSDGRLPKAEQRGYAITIFLSFFFVLILSLVQNIFSLISRFFSRGEF